MACCIEPALLVHTSNVFTITKRSVKCVNYPAIDNFNIANVGFADCTSVIRLAAFIRMENDRLDSNFGLGDCFDFNFSLKKLMARPL